MQRPRPKPRRPAAKPTIDKTTLLGTITLRVRPWATVFVDGKERGNTPVLSEVRLPAGRHVIIVRHPSLGERAQAVTLKGGDSVQLNFDLRH